MGTSSAYGGTPGWKGVRDHTNRWIEQRPGGNGGGGGPPTPPPEPPPLWDPRVESPPNRPPRSPGILLLLGALARALASGTSSHGGGGGSGGAARTIGRAAALGGTASAGAYGYRSRDAVAVADSGLTLAELDGLSPLERAKRIVDAASGQAASIADAEIKTVNARVVMWSLEQEEDPAPADVVRQWVTEYVWEVWLTEAGATLRESSGDSDQMLSIEKEVRATLEAAMAGVAIPPAAVRAADFSDAIAQLLGTLERIFGHDSDEEPLAS